MSSFAVILGLQVRQKISVVSRLNEKDAVRYIAEAGIKKAIARIKKEETKTYASFGDTFASSPESFKDIGMGEGMFSVGYAVADDMSGKIVSRYAVIDEAGKLNINRASNTTLERFFRIMGLGDTEAQELAASIVDWRDADSELTIPLGSAESPYYRNLTLPYEAKNSDFEVLDEVLLVKGMDAATFSRLKNFITIYGDGKVNINTASRQVLLALGLSGALVDKILAFRYGKDGILGTADDYLFDLPANITARLSQFSPLSDSEVAQLSVVVDQSLATNANYFMIKSVASLRSRTNAGETVSVVDRKGRIVYWRES